MPAHFPTTPVDLSYSELRYRRLFEAAHDGILIVDPATRQIVDVNPFLVKFLGYTHEEFIGRELFQIGLLRDEAASRAAFRELQTKGFIRYEDLPLETKDGRRVDVEFVSNLYQEGDRQVIQCNIRDISARKLADAALHQSEDRFKLVARAVSDVVWDWDLVTGGLWWNEGFYTTFGFAADEIAPGLESWKERVHPDERTQLMEGVYQAIESGAESWNADYRFRRKDGVYAFVQARGYILRDAAGRGVRMVGGVRDLTRQKTVEAQFLRAQRMESIGTLAGGIAHDLNNVLTPIMMSIELLKLESSDDPDRDLILDTIHASCRRGADLVRQVLSFARGLDGQRVPLRLRQLVEDLQGIIGKTFPRNIAIVTRIPAELWPVAGDPTQLHQVLLNLAVNARDAMPGGGTLTLTATNVDAAVLNGGVGAGLAAGTGRRVLIEVKDTGTGIPLEIRERIFEPFFTTKEIGKGTGLGLATVHTIVRSHGGLVTMESEMGVGTIFRIHLPADPALRTGATNPPFLPDVLRGRNELVLVVEDESSIRHVTQRTLEAFGYRVLVAGDGAEGIAIYASRGHEIAVVLTDMMMPVMDGTATIQALTRINPDVKIISVSGLAMSPHFPGSRVAGFLAKPYSAQTLVRLVRDVIDRSQDAQSNN